MCTKTACIGGDCYACDSAAVGVRDRRPEGGSLEMACSRHADPAIPVFHACMYCNEPVRKDSLEIDRNFAHKSCHKSA
jgi:hypothetical protein